MRSFTSQRSIRPSIHELASFLLNNQPQVPRCSSVLKRASPRQSSASRRTSLGISRSLSHSTRYLASPKPKTHDRGPRSSEDTQTDFGVLDVLGNSAAPSTSIDACLSDGFHLNNGIKITGGDGVLLVGGEAFTWRPWELVKGKEGQHSQAGKALVNDKGQFEVAEEAWGVFGVVWPKPDLLIMGLGGETRPLSPKTRQYLNTLGIRVDVSDTRNAAAMFNLLATERGVGSVAAALVPIG